MKPPFALRTAKRLTYQLDDSPPLERAQVRRAYRLGIRAKSHRCLCGRFIGTDGCGKCLHYVCERCKKVADHTNGTTDRSELCDACWSAEFADTQEDMAS